MVLKGYTVENVTEGLKGKYRHLMEFKLAMFHDRLIESC